MMTNKRIDKWVTLQVALSFLILVTAPVTHLYFPSGIKIIGGILFAIGLAVGVISFFELGTSFTPFIQPTEKGYLKTEGIYQIMRHPMYSGAIMIAFGWSLMWGTLLGLILSIAFAFVLDQKASAEEKLLSKKYPEYADYKMRVKKFIPFIY